MTLRVTGTGTKFEAAHNYHAVLPAKVTGEHMWIVMSMFRVTPGAGASYVMGTHNLLTIEGPGCYWCEETWEPGMEKTECRGKP